MRNKDDTKKFRKESLKDGSNPQGYLNVEFDEVEGELGGGVEGEDGVLLEGLHPPVRRLQLVHPVTPVAHHHELRRLERALPSQLHPCAPSQQHESPPHQIYEHRQTNIRTR